jgi:hypothetical protein
VKNTLTVAHSSRLEELYPDFNASFVEIVPTFAWQEELLAEWSKVRRYRIKQQGGNWIADSLSEVEEEWLRKHCIQFYMVPYCIN